MFYIILWRLLKVSLAPPEQCYTEHELIQQKLILYLNTVQNSNVFQISAVSTQYF